MESIQDIVYNCVELTELNLGFISLCDDSLYCLANNLTPKILKLNLKSTPIRDEHVKALVIRCNKITELDLSKCEKITNVALTNIIENLKSTLQKLALFCCWGIIAGGRNLTSLYQLKSMPKLRYLGVNGIENEMKSLETQLPEIAINEDVYSIAEF